MDQLPWILLGIRSTPKTDLEASPADMVFGSAITVPADMVCPPDTSASHSNHLKKLRDTVGQLTPPPVSHHGSDRVNVPQSLQTCQYVFVQRGLKSVLRPPYEGPFKVISRNDKTLTIDYNGRSETVSLDRVKPAYLDPTCAVPTPSLRKRGRPPKAK